jgi:geranylgeranyl pyrophosphate synthase
LRTGLTSTRENPDRNVATHSFDATGPEFSWPLNISKGSSLDDYWQWQPELLSELYRVQAIVQEQAQSASGSIGQALVQYTARPGKMLRPAFVILGAWAGPKSGSPLPEHLIQVAAAVEVLHLSTLIHDDVIDDAPVRRGQPALHTLYGRRQAVLMGDYLLSRCFSMIAAGTNRENAERLATATGHICRGELQQLDDMTNPSLSPRAYRRRIVQKTALLFTASLVVGANEAKAKRTDEVALARIGYNVGMAFQIIDDLLDFTSDETTLGKPVAADLRVGLFTLPVIEAAARHPEIRELLRRPPRTQAEVDRIVDAVDLAGGFSSARTAARVYTDRAERALRTLSNSAQRETLTEVTRRLLDRRY